MQTENDNGKQPAFPMITEDFSKVDSRSGLTKREYFAAMAKVPDVIIQQEIDMWKGDNNKLPNPHSQEFYKMMDAIANLEVAYQIRKADTLLTELNK